MNCVPIKEGKFFVLFSEFLYLTVSVSFLVVDNFFPPKLQVDFVSVSLYVYIYLSTPVSFSRLNCDLSTRIEINSLSLSFLVVDTFFPAKILFPPKKVSFRALFWISSLSWFFRLSYHLASLAKFELLIINSTFLIFLDFILFSHLALFAEFESWIRDFPYFSYLSWRN